LILIWNFCAFFSPLTLRLPGLHRGNTVVGLGMGRDDQLRSLLPLIDSEYSLDHLSQAETEALEAAFGDGFGDVGSPGYVPMPPPPEVRSGLIRHSFFVHGRSEYDHQENPDEFWDWDDDRPPPSDSFPLGFVLRRLRLYFENQVDRFCAHLIREESGYGSIEREMLEELASRRLYKKSWYEYHAVQLLDWIEKPEFLGKTNLPFWFASSFAGTLGRLVEQYYWRFRFEKDTVTGVGARAGASMGGKAKARLHEAEHSEWQAAAATIWSRRPNLGKLAVAQLVKKQLSASQTAKHIARFIKRT
jgi:hypothetical protein